MFNALYKMLHINDILEKYVLNMVLEKRYLFNFAALNLIKPTTYYEFEACVCAGLNDGAGHGRLYNR